MPEPTTPLVLGSILRVSFNREILPAQIDPTDDMFVYLMIDMDNQNGAGPWPHGEKHRKLRLAYRYAIYYKEKIADCYLSSIGVVTNITATNTTLAMQASAAVAGADIISPARDSFWPMSIDLSVDEGKVAGSLIGNDMLKTITHINAGTLVPALTGTPQQLGIGDVVMIVQDCMTELGGPPATGKLRVRMELGYYTEE